jgi:adenylate cyclase
VLIVELISGRNQHMSDYKGGGPDGRRLVAVVHADMVGYSRLIELDDTRTLARLRALRATLFDPTIARFGGRIVQTAGDSLLMFFDSVTDAVNCAVRLQQALPDHDPAHSSDRAIIFRMGIDLGDVITDGADFHGNGVIVAVRLQAACPPGHVCVSRTVRDHVAGRLDLAFEPMGELSLKNVARPVEAFLVAGHAARTTGAAPASAPAFPPHTTTPPFSLVVLPFTNTSGQAGDDHLVAAIGDDLTTELSRIAGHRVIARTTAATYRGSAVDARRIGAELRVHYIIEGSARKFGQVLHLNVQLIAAPDNTRLWGDRFEQDMTDIGAGIDAMVRKVSAVLDIQILDAEIARRARARPGQPDAYDYVIRSWLPGTGRLRRGCRSRSRRG